MHTHALVPRDQRLSHKWNAKHIKYNATHMKHEAKSNSAQQDEYESDHPKPLRYDNNVPKSNCKHTHTCGSCIQRLDYIQRGESPRSEQRLTGREDNHGEIKRLEWNDMAMIAIMEVREGARFLTDTKRWTVGTSATELGPVSTSSYESDANK